MREFASLLLTYVSELIHLKRRENKRPNANKKEDNSKKGA
jgi:hypothetical protein